MSRAAGTIALIGFPAREQNLLEVFFAGSDNPGLALDTPERAHALLVNLETEVERKRFLDWYASRESCPVVAVTGDLPAPEGMLEVRRPLSIASLCQTLRTLARELKRRREAREATSEAARASGSGLKMAPSELRSLIASNQAAATVKPARHTSVRRPQQSPAEALLLRWSDTEKGVLLRHVCGSLPDLDPSAAADRARLALSLEGQFLTQARTAVKLAREAQQPVQVTGIPGQFIYFPQSDSFTYDLEPDFLLQMAASRFGPGELGCQLREGAVPAAAQAPRDEMIWLLALFTTRGRVPDYLDPAGRYQLKPVSNLSRFLLPPQAERVAELWQQAPHRPIDVSRSLKIPQRYVFSFLAAADAVDLFERK
jgi:hypothetical protein